MTTYIPATLSGHTASKVTGPRGTVSKAGLKAYGLADLEFVSQSAFHHDGSFFTGAAAVKEYGPVVVELRHGLKLFSIEYHPGKPPTIR